MRAGTLFPVAALVALVLAGCAEAPLPPGTALLEPFEVGTARAEVLTGLPVGGLESSDPVEAAQLLHGYWMDRYFMDGIYVEVLWLYDTATGVPMDNFRETLNPVIFRDQVLDGWGWAHFDMRREEWRIVERQPAPPATAAVPPGESAGGEARVPPRDEVVVPPAVGEEGGSVAPVELPATLGATA